MTRPVEQHQQQQQQHHHHHHHHQHKTPEPSTSNPDRFANLVNGQRIAYIHLLPLELHPDTPLIDAPVAYKTWGTLNDAKDNVMVICHALTGTADVEDWWGPLIGPNRALDTTRFFIVCCNVLGSPYGSASPLTHDHRKNQKQNENENDPHHHENDPHHHDHPRDDHLNRSGGTPCFGPDFPTVTIRDDVRAHKLVLDQLGVRRVAVVIGGSLGGMQALEWAFLGKEYVGNVVAIATSGRHSAWCISWGEAQRQAIYSDPNYEDGYYDLANPPSVGLSAARMSALLTYRSRDSFESRFGRKTMNVTGSANTNPNHLKTTTTTTTKTDSPLVPPSSSSSTTKDAAATTPVFSAQSYLRYQGRKFVNRFDANCYVALTRKMDTHDVARGREGSFEEVLGTIEQPVLIIGIETDGLFTISEQYELAEHIPRATMVVLQSRDGHDGFLLEFEQVNRHIIQFLNEVIPKLDTSTSSSSSVDVDADPVADPVAGESDRSSSVASEVADGVCAW